MAFSLSNWRYPVRPKGHGMANNTVHGSAKPKGKPRGASRAGIPNKATADARAAIGAFVDGNAHRLTGWLDAVAAENPEKAFQLFQSVVEYHVPKLARTELTGKNGGPVVVAASPLDERL